jgi:hypothetical protein
MTFIDLSAAMAAPAASNPGSTPLKIPDMRIFTFFLCLPL